MTPKTNSTDELKGARNVKFVYGNLHVYVKVVVDDKLPEFKDYYTCVEIELGDSPDRSLMSGDSKDLMFFKKPGMRAVSRTVLGRAEMSRRREMLSSHLAARIYGTSESSCHSADSIASMGSFEVEAVSEDDRIAFMLGKLPASLLFSREHVCPSCGAEHPNPRLLDMYGACVACHAILREACHLRKRYEGVPVVDPLEVLFATYGDPFQPLKACDVTQACRERAINDLLCCPDPSPGHNKQLRLRYRMGEVYGTLILDVMANNKFPGPVALLVPKSRSLFIKRALYGHPKGRSSTGAMSFDVTEIVQGQVDLHGGSYLNISLRTPLAPLFGDPCPGYSKDLRVEYEVCGRSDTIEREERRGRLTKRVYVEESPVVAPLIVVESATYGITPIGRRDRIRKLETQYYNIKALEYKMMQGEFITPQETALVKFHKQPLLDELHAFKSIPQSFIDVSTKLQVIAEKNGSTLRLDSQNFDPNAIFGNPLPGTSKLLEVSLVCHGHDSEKWTETSETTTTGHPRNYITSKAAKFSIPVSDVGGRGVMESPLVFETSFAAPVIHITRATYGNFLGASKITDCTSEIQSKVQGPILSIGEHEDLTELFSVDPCPGQRKQLRIEFVTRGFVGNIRVRERNGLLTASVHLGYMPNPGADS